MAPLAMSLVESFDEDLWQDPPIYLRGDASFERRIQETVEGLFILHVS